MPSQNIVVICGGLSEEREVSLRSGANVHAALQRIGYTNAELFDFKDYSSLETLIHKKRDNKIDLAFLLTHGTYGEDGCIQGFLELLGVPYTGSKVETSAICMNKVRTKEVLAAYDLPILKTYSAKTIYENLFKNPSDARHARGEHNAADEDLWTDSIIMKPSVGGSSVGITKFNSQAEFMDFITQNPKVKNELDKYFIEKFIRGTEVTTSIIEADSKLIKKNQEHCKVLEIDSLISLPILELRPKKEFYDYEAKYTKGMTEFVLPAEISKDIEEKIHNYALKAFQAVGCKGAARVDFIIDRKTSQPYILEVNTLPGMTDTSDLPAQANAAGIEYDEVVDVIARSEATSRSKLALN